MTNEAHNRNAAIAATLCAGLMIAAQVAGKAARDALFLSHFDVETLPRMIIATAVLSLVAITGMVRILARFGPQETVPIAFGASALTMVGVGALAPASPGLAAILLYLQIGTVGAVLISGFWSVVNERFDPRAARASIGRIAVGGTLGGVAGGALAMASARTIPVESVIWVLAGLQLLCVPLVWSMRKGHRRRPVTEALTALDPQNAQAGNALTGAKALLRDPYLCTVAGLVLCVAMTEGFVDFAFKSQAQARFGDGPQLLSFFAVFYAAISLFTFVLQLGLGRRLLERFGMLPSLVSLPVGVGVTVSIAMLAPSLVTATITRATESVLRSSLYRSGYELLYVPVAADTKRVTKTLIDVGMDRIGNAVGGLAITGLLLVGLGAQPHLLLAGALLFSAAAVVLARRLRRGYSQALEESMLNQALELELTGATDDEELRSTLLLTLGELDIGAFMRGGNREEIEPTLKAELGDELAKTLSTAQRKSFTPASDENNEITAAPRELRDFNRPTGPLDPSEHDPVVSALKTLRSGDAPRIRAFFQEAALPAEVASHVLPLLAWDPVAREAIYALRPLADQIVGQLTDALVSPSTDFTIRRRLPRVLSAARSERAVESLVRGLSDTRFEVRFQCGQALRRLRRDLADVALERTIIVDAVAQELTVDKHVWESHRLIDADEDATDGDSPFVVEAIRVRSQRSLQHVFTLLALVFPEDPLHTAYRALHTDDAALRGTALEYLESILPARIHRTLLPHVEDRPRSPAPARPREEVLRALLLSHRSIQMNLERIRQSIAEPD